MPNFTWNRFPIKILLMNSLPTPFWIAQAGSLAPTRKASPCARLMCIFIAAVLMDGLRRGWPANARLDAVITSLNTEAAQVTNPVRWAAVGSLCVFVFSGMGAIIWISDPVKNAYPLALAVRGVARLPLRGRFWNNRVHHFEVVTWTLRSGHVVFTVPWHSARWGQRPGRWPVPVECNGLRVYCCTMTSAAFPAWWNPFETTKCDLFRSKPTRPKWAWRGHLY